MPSLKSGRKKSASQAATSDVRLDLPAPVPRMMSAELGGSDLELRMAEAERKNEELMKRIAELELNGGSPSSSLPPGDDPANAALRATVAELQQQDTALRATVAELQQQLSEHESPTRDETAAWLESKGALAELSHAISELCGGQSPADNPGPLHKVEDVRAKLEKECVPRLAGLISDAASRAARAKSVAAVALWTPDERVEEPGTRALFEEALAKQQAHTGSAHDDAFPGADHIYSMDGLPPWMWGVNKRQFEAFIDDVRAAHAAGKIVGQPDETKPFYYDPKKFDDPNVGPNMHQINQWMIKPMTRELQPLPGVSYALGKNLRTGGLRCSLFFSHAWDEGVYELAAHALAAWPEELSADEHGAYICCLSNPQNLDITAVLNHPDGSPFARVLGAEPRPAYMIMLANVNTAIHSRLWCVLEAHVARQMAVPSRIEGPATQLLMGARGEELKRLELEVEEQTARAKKQALTAFEQGLSETSKEAKAKAEQEQATIQAQIVQLKEQLATEKLKVLVAPASELIKLDEAGCSYEQDAADIRSQISGSEAVITELIADLVRDNVCGVERVRAEAVDGPLGRLPLDGSLLNLQASEALGTSSGVLQLGQWFRSSPLPGAQLNLRDNPKAMAKLLPTLVRELKECETLASLNLSRNDLGPDGAEALTEVLKVNAAINSINLDGSALPVKQLKGTEPVETLDLSQKGLGAVSGIVIAKLIEGNTAMTTITLDGGALPVKQLKGTEPVQTLNLSSKRLDSVSGIVIAKLIEFNAALTSIDVGFNRLKEEVALDIVRAVKPRDQMTFLGLAQCSIGPTGAKEIAEYMQFSTAMTSITLDGDALPVKQLKGTEPVQTLDLSRKRLGSVSGIIIAKLVEFNTALTSITLEDSVVLPVKQLKGTEPVKTLDLSNKKLGFLSGIVIAKLIEFNTALTNLNLYNNEIGRYGAKEMAKMLKVNTALTELNVAVNEIGPDGGKALAEALKVNTALNKLDLRYNGNMRDEEKQELRDSVKGREGFELLV